MDVYVIKYLLEYLSLCHSCNRYDIYDKKDTCSICNSFYCSKCKPSFYKVVGFYKENFCSNCVSIIML